MKKDLQRLEAFVADSRFGLYCLAIAGFLLMPSSWGGPVFASIVAATIYRVFKNDPGMINERLKWAQNSEIQRVVLTGVLWVLYDGLRMFSWAFFHWRQTNSVFIGFVLIPLFLLQCVFFFLNSSWNSCRKDVKLLQRTHTKVHRMFMCAFFCSVVLLVCAHGGVGDWISGWLAASMSDANLPIVPLDSRSDGSWSWSNEHIASLTFQQWASLMNVFITLVIASLLRPWAVRFSALLTTLSNRLHGNWNHFSELLISTLRAPRTYLKMRELHPFMKNAATTFWFLVGCYAFLFWFVGASDGPVAAAIVGWLDASLADANTGMNWGASANPNLRMFCGAIVALYGTVPLAVTASVFLPYVRRKQIILTCDGVLFPDGPGLLWTRPMHLWTDFASVDVKRPAKNASEKNTHLLIKFHAGGRLDLLLAQLSKTDLEKLLSAVDEQAVNCKMSDAAISLLQALRSADSGVTENTELGSLPAEAFQSTIFVPHEIGSWLPDGESRVVRILATRPLSAVYLVRTEAGQLTIVKQFFLAEDNEQTQALRKCLEREYELLSTLCHPSMSKVMQVFHRDQSTYLVLEHARGTDLRTLVSSDGARSEQAVLDWAIQLCDTMIYLHGQEPPVVHRDLTPDNVILAEDGSVKIIDFGAAHQFLEGITGTIIGKQSYVPPEQLRGQAGPRSDIYSFGCMLHFLLTAEDPIALTKCVPMIKADVSPDLNDLIGCCTEFEPEARPESFVELKERLQKIKVENSLVSVLSKLAAPLMETQLESKPVEITNQDEGLTIEIPKEKEHVVQNVGSSC